MVNYSLCVTELLLLSYADAFSSINNFSHLQMSSLSLSRQPVRHRSKTKLHVSSNLDPEDVIPLGQERNITPEGFGFSSTTSRILRTADRNSGYYRAKASDIVTNVMEGITDGQVDVALVFDDTSNELLGIFTETDYIKV